MNHLNSDVYEITVIDTEGLTEKLRPTGSHRFYSVDRNNWVKTRELQNGERLKGLKNGLRVASLIRLSGAQTVYNMTVEGDHVYYASLLWSHNNCPDDPFDFEDPIGLSPEDQEYADELIDALNDLHANAVHYQEEFGMPPPIESNELWEQLIDQLHMLGLEWPGPNK